MTECNIPLYPSTCVDRPIKIKHYIRILCGYFIPEGLYSVALMNYAMNMFTLFIVGDCCCQNNVIRSLRGAAVA